MKHTTRNKLVLLATIFMGFAMTHSVAHGQSPFSETEADRIGTAAETSATLKDGVVRISLARDDVKVTVDGMPLKPFAGLGSWAAFTKTPHGAMVMGDTVVFQDEVTPAMDAAFSHGLEVTALHNHFFFDEPKVYFMHIGGRGNPEALAKGVKAVWDAIKIVRSKTGQPAKRFPGETPDGANTISKAEVERIVGHEAQAKDGVVKISIGREGKMHGVPIGGAMGLGTWAAFSGSDDLATVDGDFIMTAPEVQSVLKTLRKHEIHIVALHNHMIGEEPTFYFTHYWGKGMAEELATAIRAALDAQQAAKDAHSHKEAR
tara:strand:- start:26567 stop:27517 length:951 start_codon:yes stop_codon:yes gene_type:complete